uniref:Uncharacterized protein n=1 Tax=Anguilla anguilla TaxID=7936 RepID=A0A0E9P9R7_ANGAN
MLSLQYRKMYIITFEFVFQGLSMTFHNMELVILPFVFTGNYSFYFDTHVLVLVHSV